jgi:hypothetical protein
MSKGRLIAFSGAAGVGKDTAAEPLIEAGFKVVRFADPFKDALATMLGVSREKLEDRAFKEAELPEIGQSPRRLMQTLGSDWGRNMVTPNLWVILAMRRVDQLLDSGIDVVMTDCRFPNEAAAVHARGGKVVKILRKTADSVPAHESELGLPACVVDVVIENDSPDAKTFGAKVAAALGVGVVRRALDFHDRVPIDPVQAMAQIQQGTSRYPAELVEAAAEAAASETALEQRRRKELSKAAVGEVTSKVEQDFTRFNRDPRRADGV